MRRVRLGRLFQMTPLAHGLLHGWGFLKTSISRIKLAFNTLDAYLACSLSNPQPDTCMRQLRQAQPPVQVHHRAHCCALLLAPLRSLINVLC